MTSKSHLCSKLSEEEEGYGLKTRVLSKGQIHSVTSSSFYSFSLLSGYATVLVLQDMLSHDITGTGKGQLLLNNGVWMIRILSDRINYNNHCLLDVISIVVTAYPECQHTFIKQTDRQTSKQKYVEVKHSRKGETNHCISSGPEVSQSRGESGGVPSIVLRSEVFGKKKI